MPANIKPLKMCINITIPSVEDTDLSLYEAMCTLASKLQDTINEINNILEDVIVSVNGHQGPEVLLTGDDISTSVTILTPISKELGEKYSENNQPPYPVTSVNSKTGAVEINGGDISVSDTDDQSIAGVLSQKYGADNPPPYPVTSVNGKTGAAILTADDVSATNGTVQQALNTKLAYSNQEYTSWNSVRTQPCGVYRTSGFVPWSTSISDNGLLYIIGSNLSSVAYIFIRNSVPNTLYFAIGQGTSPSDWFFIEGNPISG